MSYLEAHFSVTRWWHYNKRITLLFQAWAGRSSSRSKSATGTATASCVTSVTPPWLAAASSPTETISCALSAVAPKHTRRLVASRRTTQMSSGAARPPQQLALVKLDSMMIGWKGVVFIENFGRWSERVGGTKCDFCLGLFFCTMQNVLIKLNGDLFEYKDIDDYVLCLWMTLDYLWSHDKVILFTIFS